MNHCESCGMQLDEYTVSKFDKRYCIHCQDQQTGDLKSKEDVREGSIQATMRTTNKGRDEAKRMVDEKMPDLPRWQ